MMSYIISHKSVAPWPFGVCTLADLRRAQIEIIDGRLATEEERNERRRQLKELLKASKARIEAEERRAEP